MGVNDRASFTISTPYNKEPGVLYVIAKTLDIAVASVIRNDLVNYNQLLEEAVQKLGDSGRESFEEAAKLLAHSTIPRIEGLTVETKEDAAIFMASAGKMALARFVRGLDTATTAALLHRARALAAFPNTDGKFDDSLIAQIQIR